MRKAKIFLGTALILMSLVSHSPVLAESKCQSRFKDSATAKSFAVKRELKITQLFRSGDVWTVCWDPAK
jgi:hypothetical protein